jgi:folate-binding protein YgfZ
MLIHQYRPATLLKVTGEDAATYLQGQFSNDLKRPAGAAVYGLWLNQKGKILADAHVLKLAENEFQVASPASDVGVIMPRLEEYIVADDVVLADETASVFGLAVTGPGCGAIIRQVLGSKPSAGEFLRLGELLAFAGRRARGENYELIGPEKAIAEIMPPLLAAGGHAATAGEMELCRIIDGIPSVPRDLGPGDLPQEGGLEDTEISYTKGCYLGQEVMARLKSLGQVRRRLHVIQGSGKPPATLDAIYQGDRKVGQVRSVAARETGFVAMAMLSLVNLAPAGGLSLAPEASPTIALIPHG